MQQAERVSKAAPQQRRHLLALLRGEAGVLRVGLGVFQVDFLVRHVHVAADHHGLLPVQSAQIVREGVLPGHAVVKPRQPSLAVGRVDRHQKEALKLQRDDAPLMVVFLRPDAHLHRQRLTSGENCGAGIPLLLGAVPVLRVPLGRKVSLSGLHLGFL